jgi:hypothetical protein
MTSSLRPTLGADLRAQLTRAKPYHLRYITKQRVPFGPGIDATHRHRRQSSEKIVRTAQFQHGRQSADHGSTVEAIGQGFPVAFKTIF